MIEIIGYSLGGIFVFVALASAIKIVRPFEKGAIERFGKYNRFAEGGLYFLVPFIEKIEKVNISEDMVEIDTQEIITEDNLNAKVDLVVFYKVKEDEASVKKSLYKVNEFEPQIVKLAQTTTRNVIGTMLFKDVNSKRNELNAALVKILKRETENWGVDIVRVELKDITPPKEVQDTMNKVIQASNEKRASVDFATAVETRADGDKRATIKQAQGQKESKILIAEGASKAYDLVNKHFRGNAKILKQLEVTQIALQNNAKIVITEKGIKPNIILGNLMKGE